MIEAGVAAYLSWDESDDLIPELAKAVFLAMRSQETREASSA